MNVDIAPERPGVIRSAQTGEVLVLTDFSGCDLTDAQRAALLDAPAVPGDGHRAWIDDVNAAVDRAFAPFLTDGDW